MRVGVCGVGRGVVTGCEGDGRGKWPHMQTDGDERAREWKARELRKCVDLWGFFLKELFHVWRCWHRSRGCGKEGMGKVNNGKGVVFRGGFQDAKACGRGVLMASG